MEIEQIKESLLNPEYDFLKSNKYLGNNILLLTLGGSYAYGTNVETSDIDIRGVAINPSKQIFGLEKDFEQIVETKTDTTIYSLNKMCKLLTSCNPNTIEILGCLPEHYLYTNEAGRLLLENKQNFLSTKAIDTFGGYANAQYNRLEHALLGNGQNNEKKLEMLLHSLECSLAAFNAKHKHTKSNICIRILNVEEYEEVIKHKYEDDKESINLVLADKLKNIALNTLLNDTEKASKIQSACDLYKNDMYELEEWYSIKMHDADEAIDERIVLDGDFTQYPVGDIQSLLRDFHKIKSEYGNINKRNTKKDVIHMAKHMMHLIRLFKMGTRLNQAMEIKTHWDGKDLEEMMAIRNGYFMESDGLRVKPEFYDLYHKVQNEYKYAVANTVLPKHPNIEALNEMLLSIYRMQYALR